MSHASCCLALSALIAAMAKAGRLAGGVRSMAAGDHPQTLQATMKSTVAVITIARDRDAVSSSQCTRCLEEHDQQNDREQQQPVHPWKVDLALLGLGGAEHS